MLPPAVSGAGANAVISALMVAAPFPVYANLLSQFVTRRDETGSHCRANSVCSERQC